MKKIFATSLICFLLASSISAQETLFYTHPDADFHRGKELFNQRKYAASSRSFDSFLSKATVVQAGQIQEAEFYKAVNAYYLQQKDAAAQMHVYLTKHPYTPFSDLANFVLGMLQYQAKKYNEAATYFERVNPKRLGQQELTEYLFSKGYAYLQIKKYENAREVFSTLKAMQTKYQQAAIYYLAYSNYTLGQYELALPLFLSLETLDAYKHIVPYYIIQIYYFKNDFASLNERANALLVNNPNNPANAEIYRIKGEIAYSKKDYATAIENLKKYERMSPQALRNNLYMLGLALFNHQKFKESILYLSKTTTENDEMSENAYSHIGSANIRLGDKTNARLAFEAALRTKFNSAVREEALFNYALTTYETLTAFGESIKAFEQFLAEFPRSKNADKAQNYLATAYFSSKNYDTALQSINKIQNPNARIIEAKQYVLYQLGTEAFVQQNNNKALDYFSQAIQTSRAGKFAADSYYWRSEVYYRLQQPDASVNDLNAFFSHPNASQSVNFKLANYSLGYAHFARKNYSEALNWFLKYINIETDLTKPTFSDALNRIGDCYFYERNFTKAESFYNRAATVSPATGDYAIFQSAYVAGLQKNYLGKIASLEKLLSMYPKSEYADESMYEIGRSYLMLDNNAKAIAAFKDLVSKFPASASARKGAIVIGMIYFDSNNFDEAIAAYKKVITFYPSSEEAKVALESLEAAYIEKNDVASYLAYTRTLNLKISGNTSARADSISYIAAEKQYMNTNYAQAIVGFESYLKNYCPGGRYCTEAQYFLADSYYRINNKDKAYAAFLVLTQIPGNQYMQEAYTRCAEIAYDRKDYENALLYFKQLQRVAQTNNQRNMARLGILRCSYFLNDHQNTILIAGEILSDPKSDDQVRLEARYNRAKAHLAQKQLALAIPDLRALSADTRTVFGAEAKYLLANLYFEQNNLVDAEKEIMDFAKKNTPHQVWLARSFVLLADINILLKNDFQAKQYLLSLQKNYTEPDEIQTMINERLQAINQRENDKVITR